MSTPTWVPPAATAFTSSVRIAADGGSLVGELSIPDEATAIAVFAYTNAASLGNDNRRLAQLLREHGYATLLFDLLRPDEERVDAQTHQLGEDLPLLSRRLIDAIDWLGQKDATANLSVGLIGERSTAAAAFIAACMRPNRVAAVVSYAERPDFASAVLGHVEAPTLLIVRGDEAASIRANDTAFRRLHCPHELARAHAAASGTKTDEVREVSRLILAWFEQHLHATTAANRVKPMSAIPSQASPEKRGYPAHLFSDLADGIRYGAPIL